MYTSNYPAEAGHRGHETSRIAARMVDAEPDRKLDSLTNAVMRVLMEGDLIPDEIAERIGEPVLYTRPRISELVNLGIVIKSRVKKASPTHGRPASVIRPSADLYDFLCRHDAEIDDEADLKRVVSAMVVSRIEAERLALQIARRGVPVDAGLA